MDIRRSKMYCVLHGEDKCHTLKQCRNILALKEANGKKQEPNTKQVQQPKWGQYNAYNPPPPKITEYHPQFNYQIPVNYVAQAPPPLQLTQGNPGEALPPPPPQQQPKTVAIVTAIRREVDTRRPRLDYVRRVNHTQNRWS